MEGSYLPSSLEDVQYRGFTNRQIHNFDKDCNRPEHHHLPFDWTREFDSLNEYKNYGLPQGLTDALISCCKEHIDQN